MKNVYNYLILFFSCQVIDRVEEHYQCVKREGQYFLVNVLALSGMGILKISYYLTKFTFSSNWLKVECNYRFDWVKKRKL